jgi:hypothetical protein
MSRGDDDEDDDDDKDAESSDSKDENVLAVHRSTRAARRDNRLR